MGRRDSGLGLIIRLLNPVCSGIFYFLPMREDLLHYIWKFRKFNSKSLRTVRGNVLNVLDPGKHNKYSGPDFTDARIEIDGQLWAGNVEIHLNSSDWYAHRHHMDPAYSNLVLHVVWNCDKLVFEPSGEQITTLVLKDYVDESLLENYKKLLQRKKKKFINCDDYAGDLSIFLLLPWYEHLYRERLDKKAASLSKYLDECQGDWEKAFFIWMMRGFGQQVNKSSFVSLARLLDFKIYRKCSSNLRQLECLLYGVSGLLENKIFNDPYTQSLKEEFQFLKRKYKIGDTISVTPEFMGVRPLNFPTIRLSQLAVLYHTHRAIFSKIMEAKYLSEIQELLDVQASPYWNNHYTFGNPSKFRAKRLSRSFRQSLIINSILPAKYLFAREHGKDIYLHIRTLVSQLQQENNAVINKFKKMKFPVHHALDSQALLQLFNAYCLKNRCLECALGNQILN